MVLDNYKSDISQEMSPQFIRVIITDQLKLVRARIFVQLTAWCRDGKSLDVENMLIWQLSNRWGLSNPMVHVSNVIWYPIKKPNPWDTRNEHPGVPVFINILTWDKINKLSGAQIKIDLMICIVGTGKHIFANSCPIWVGYSTCCTPPDSTHPVLIVYSPHLPSMNGSHPVLVSLYQLKHRRTAGSREIMKLTSSRTP